MNYVKVLCRECQCISRVRVPCELWGCIACGRVGDVRGDTVQSDAATDDGRHGVQLVAVPIRTDTEGDYRRANGLYGA